MLSHTSIFNWTAWYLYAQYMCILLYVIVIWCNGISDMYCQLEWGVDLCSVYVHSDICDTYLV